ncbi:MAG: hypothetical protein ACREBP_05925, partial [Sphingomicrobium sp.]
IRDLKRGRRPARPAALFLAPSGSSHCPLTLRNELHPRIVVSVEHMGRVFWETITMGNERDDKKFGENKGSGGQGQESETGKQNAPTGGQGETAGQGDTTGEGETAGQEATGQTQPSGGTDTMTDDPSAGRESGGSDPTGEGFVGSQGPDSGDYLQKKGKKDDGDIEGTSDKPPLDGE